MATVTYDLYLWKRAAGARLTRGLAYLCAAEGVEHPGLSPLPRDELWRLLTAEFGDEPSFELDVEDVRVFVGLPHAEAPALSGWFQTTAAALGLELYDPQLEQPSDDDARAFEALSAVQAAVGASADLQHWLQLAQRGDPAGMNELGNAYADGEGVPVDWAQAASWYQQAAAKGFLPSLLNLALCHRLGEGVTKDAALAAQLYAEAFQQDQCLAAFALGEMYRDGEGVEASLDRAEEYFKAARANRHPEAYLALKGIGRAPAD